VHHKAKIVIVIVIVEILSSSDFWRTEAVCFILKVVGIVKHNIIIGKSSLPKSVDAAELCEFMSIFDEASPRSLIGTPPPSCSS